MRSFVLFKKICNIAHFNTILNELSKGMNDDVLFMEHMSSNMCQDSGGVSPSIPEGERGCENSGI